MGKKYLALFAIILIVIIALVLYFNEPPISNRNLETQQYKILEIQLKVKAPFSTSSLTIIFQDGSALYSRKQEGEDEKETNYGADSFTKLELETISKLVHQNNFFSLTDKPYTKGSPLDGSTYTISVKAVSSTRPKLANAFTHSVSCYQFNCEKKFKEIKEVIISSFDEKIVEVGA